MDKFHQPYSIQSPRRWSRNTMSDEEEAIFKMSDNEASNFRLHRRSSSSSSSSQKMCIDSDDRVRTNNPRWRQAPTSPLADYIDKSTQIRRPSMIRCHSDTQISFSSVPTTSSTNNMEDAMSETGSIDGSIMMGPTSRRKSYSVGSHSPIPNTYGTDRERSTGGGPERRSVTRRGSLLVSTVKAWIKKEHCDLITMKSPTHLLYRCNLMQPKGRQLARIMNQLEVGMCINLPPPLKIRVNHADLLSFLEIKGRKSIC